MYYHNQNILQILRSLFRPQQFFLERKSFTLNQDVKYLLDQIFASQDHNFYERESQYLAQKITNILDQN